MNGLPQPGLAALVLLPLAGCGLCWVLRAPKRILAVTWLASLLSALAAAPAVWACLHCRALQEAQGWLALDALSAFHLAVMYGVFILSSAYAQIYFDGGISSGELSLAQVRQFASLWLGSLAALTLTLVSNNLGMMWVGMEATTLLTAFLIIVRRSPDALEAMWKYLLICSVGIAFAFIGTLLVAASAKGLVQDPGQLLHWSRLMAAASGLNPKLLKAGFLFVLVGYGTKAGLAPMHSWLPDAHSQAPAPVSAVFSGCMLNAGLYCILRYGALCHALPQLADWSAGLLRLLGLLSISVAAVFILFQNDGKRLLAYSSVEHLGIIALGMGLGTPGIFAALFHTLNHALGKSVGFFCMGRLGQIYGTNDLRRLAGAARREPVWGNGLLLSLLAILGAAPFAVFLSEFLVLKAAVEAHRAVVVAVFLAGTCIIFISASRRVIAAAWGEPAAPARLPGPRAGLAATLLVALPLALLLCLGVWMPGPFRGALERCAAVLNGGR